ncbi:hypothetical protein FRC14_000289 [Serendipita sp. 396]|nr:hypothetical protein FRC14_000289 [Serendipita sp. 396]
MDTGTNNIASSSSHTQTIDNTTEPTETTRLLAGHDKTHEAIGDVEDPSLEPTNNDDDDDDPRDARKDRPNPIRNKLSKERIKYASLFAIPVFLLVPSLVFFVMTLNLRATLPPSSSLETIANLTRRVSYLSKSLSACNDNTTQLATELHDERQRVEICRENEKRLAERVDIVQEMLEQCQTEENVLKKNLEDAQNDLSVCHDEKEELKRQMESGVFIQFLDMVGKMGTGGDSWVCSDQTESWSHGFTTTDAPHPTITIQTWTSELRDVEHSALSKHAAEKEDTIIVFAITADRTSICTENHRLYRVVWEQVWK